VRIPTPRQKKPIPKSKLGKTGGRIITTWFIPRLREGRVEEEVSRKRKERQEGHRAKEAFRKMEKTAGD